MEKIFLINEKNEECVPLIDQSANADFVKYNVPTDGTLNAATALQSVLNNSNGLVVFPKGTFILNSSLTIDTSKVKMIVGNGATLKVTGDFPALIVQGNPTSNNWTADPDSMNATQIEDDSSTIISGLKITSTNSDEGTGIVLTNTWTVIVRNCYIYYINAGIEVRGRNRNIIIDGNNIYQCASYGIIYSEDSNVHQTNIIGNHISYTQICVYFRETAQTANVQITGNDIEIATWPAGSLTSSRCLVIDYQKTSNTLFSEFEIVGNTIQGHEYSDGLIDIMSNNANYPIENISISGNQISNVKSGGYAIKLKNCHNIAIGHNTYRRLTSGAIFKLEGTVDCISISGETAETGATYVSADTDAVLNYVSLTGLNGKSLTKGINITCATINGLNICGCNLTGGMKVAANTVDYVSVVGNIARGTYDIATCSHRQVENNI